MSRKPNVVLVFADQWRYSATGYAGDPNVKTPVLDALAGQGVNFINAVAGCPVCSPYRASLLTGQYPLTHGVFINDVPLSDGAVSLAQAFRRGGYKTAYIGKWHLDGLDRSAYIPPGRRQGFEFWRAFGCSHDYNNSPYYGGDSDRKLTWEGYDAFAQTREAQDYIRANARGGPFLLVVSWGPPHAPYHTAPPQQRALYDPASLKLAPNVPETAAAPARRDLAGYYAHCSALDNCVGRLLETLADCGLEDDTIFLFTSDHGDMLGSQGQFKKQRPWDESIRVPFLLRFPAGLGHRGRITEKLIDAPDVMPTLLSLSGLEIPGTVEGADLSDYARGRRPAEDDAAVITCITPFGQFTRRGGGREYRGIRTPRYTYVRDLNGPWLLYDNQADPFQMCNLCGTSGSAALQARLDGLLDRRLKETNDELLPGEHYIRKWNITVDAEGEVPWKW